MLEEGNIDMEVVQVEVKVRISVLAQLVVNRKVELATLLVLEAAVT